MPAIVTSLEFPGAQTGNAAIIFPGEVGHIDLDEDLKCELHRILFVCCSIDDAGLDVFHVDLPKGTNLSAYKEDTENIGNDGQHVVEATDGTERISDLNTGYVYEFLHFSSMVEGYRIPDFLQRIKTK